MLGAASIRRRSIPKRWHRSSRARTGAVRGGCRLSLENRGGARNECDGARGSEGGLLRLSAMSARGRASHALFPGTFDPFTVGHLDLVRRALALFGRVTVGIAAHPDKHHLFSDAERADLARAATADLRGVEVRAIEGLLVSACDAIGADVIVRGARSGSDFDYEVQMARTNRAMLPRIETVLLVPDPSCAHVSSTLVRQIAAMGGDVSLFVPDCVERALRRRFAAHS